MSSPHVIIAAVHELDGDPKDFWQDESVRETLDGFEKEYDHNDEIDWQFCEGEFKSNSAKETFSVEASYHSHRGDYVIEVILEGKGSMDEIAITGMEDIIEEINFRFDRDFTLEAYYWYTGVDRPGGVER